MRYNIIACTSTNGCIGDKGKLLYSLPNDMRNFVSLTDGNIVIMGRKTYESIGKRLDNRLNIIITKDPKFQASGCLTFYSLKDALSYCDSITDGRETFFIGGASLYNEAIDMRKADVVYLTHVLRVADGDTIVDRFSFDDKEFMSKYKRVFMTQLSEDIDRNSGKGIPYYYCIYKKRH